MNFVVFKIVLYYLPGIYISNFFKSVIILYLFLMNYGKYLKASKFIGLFSLNTNSERFVYDLRNWVNSSFNSSHFSSVLFTILSIFKSKTVNYLFFKSLNIFIKS